MSDYFSPVTGRPIKFNSVTFKKLVADGFTPIKKTSKYARLSAKMTAKERTQLQQQCGTACFLQPSELKYPVCDPSKSKSKRCAVDCSLVATALRQADIVAGNKNTGAKAKAAAKKVQVAAHARLRRCGKKQ